VQVTGSNFQNGATASFGDRVTIQSVTFVSATQLTVRIKVSPQAASGARTVAITNPDGQSGSLPGCFTVN
jgi:trimeric autotransporter adhesin